MRKKLVLIGNGMAGVYCIEQLLKLNKNLYDITIIGSEPHPNYNRIMLSKVLQGDSSISEIVLHPYEWYENNNLRLFTGHRVNRIDTVTKTVYTDQNLVVSYDSLILATGSLPFILPLQGADKEGVIGFRDIRDCEKMMESSRIYTKAAVIGGGLLGLEAARGLLNLNMDVTVVHNSSYLMNRQLDSTAASMLQTELEEQGMKFLLNKSSESITGRKRAAGIRFKDGGELAADLIVMAVGIKPNIGYVNKSAIAANRGILINDYMETNVPDVYALGECAEHRGVTYGLVAPLYEQGNLLARRLAGVEAGPYTGSVVSTKLKVSGVNVFSAGHFTDGPDIRSVRMQDEFEGTYKKVLIKEGKVIGTVLFGDTSDGSRIFSLIRSGEDVTGRERTILLGEERGDAKSGIERAGAMHDEEIVCGCNGVMKQDIVRAIQEQGCSSVNDIKACTKASGSCGGCKPIVADILTYTVGEDGVTTVKEGICGCTQHTRDEIVDGIRHMRLTTSKEVMNVMEWSHPEGCSKCRPALNYYLGMIWPEEHADERESRFVNERNHANIQKDGTYSVVPRIYGGVTTPEDLKKIADVAVKYQVPLVKFTGGQRLDLFGVKKEDLPSMWEELDMPSGYAYGKTLRTVKTCVGDTFCRFGTQDAMSMGIRMEQKFERLGTPAKFKMAVSGCPRNCAEATIKDLGVVAIDGGWEIYVGGNGGTKVRASELICKVKTSEEVMEWTAAFMQYYREQANWNERTANWVERVGLNSIVEALNTSEKRNALAERIDQALRLTKDPWKEIVETPKLRKNFEPMPLEG